MRVLIVDDSDMSRMMIAAALDPSDTHDQAENGAVALAKFSRALAEGQPYDIVFMDIIMPQMDGKTALKKMRGVETLRAAKRTPIYLVSASEMIDEVTDLVDALLRKPVPRHTIRELVTAAAG